MASRQHQRRTALLSRPDGSGDTSYGWRCRLASKLQLLNTERSPALVRRASTIKGRPLFGKKQLTRSASRRFPQGHWQVL